MKVLMISRLFYPHIGGVERHVLELSKQLIKQDCEISIITEKYKNDLCLKEIVGGVNVYRISYPKVKIFGLLFIWYKIFWLIKLIKDSDVVHIHDVFIWYLPFRFLFPKKRIYTTFHGWEGELPVSRISIIQKQIASFLSNGSIAVGTYVEKLYSIKCDKITYGAVNKIKYSGVKSKNSILYVGRLSPDTGLPIFLRASDKLKNFSITFCGDGELSKECKKVGKVLGFVDPWPYLKKAEYCLASGYLTILEAFQSKCKVIVAYDNKIKRDIFLKTPFNSWIYAIRNSEDMTRVLADRREESKISEAYKWSKSQTWEKLAEEYINLWSK